MVKIFQARLQKYAIPELPDVQAGFRKGRGTRDQIANIHWIMEKAREFQKNIYIFHSSWYLAYKTLCPANLNNDKPLTVWTTTNSGKF